MSSLSVDFKFLLRYLAFVAIGLVVLYFIPKSKPLEHRLSEGLANVNPAWADTTLKYMKTDEKLAQLIFVQTDINDSTDLNGINRLVGQLQPGGLLIKSNSLNLKQQILCQADSGQAIPLFQIGDAENLLQMLSENIMLPNFQHIAALQDDSLRIHYTQTLTKAAKLLNFSATLLPEFHQPADSAAEESYLKFLSQLSQTAHNEKHTLIPNSLHFFLQDSAYFDKNKQLFGNFQTLLYHNHPEANQKPYGFHENLQKKYQFGGIVFSQTQSDSLELLQNQFLSGSHAFITEKPEETLIALKYLLNEKRISEQQIDEKVRLLLLLKTYAGLDTAKINPPDTLDDFLKTINFEVRVRRVYKKSICLLKNDKRRIPFTNVKDGKYLIINTSINSRETFIQTFTDYAEAKIFQSKISKDNLNRQLKPYVANYESVLLCDKHTDTALLNYIFEIIPAKKITLINFENQKIPSGSDSAAAIMQVWGQSKFDEEYAAEAIFGGIDIKGSLPKFNRLYASFPKSHHTPKTRVAKALPEEVGLDSELLKRIDTIAQDGIYKSAYPGCQVVVLKNGYEVFHKAYGFHDYSRRLAVKTTDIYDLASVTKIAAATTAAMRMYDQGKLSLNATLGKYFKDTKIDYSNIKPDTIINIDTLKISEIKDFRKLLKHQDTLHINDSMLIAYDTLLVRTTPNNNIFKVKIKDLLLHKSGISPTLPILPYLLYKKYYFDSLEYKKKYYRELALADSLNPDSMPIYNSRDSLQKIYNHYFSRKYIKDSADIRIAENFYFKRNYFDTLWKHTKRLRVYSRKIYQYTDINMILLQQAIDSINNSNLDSYLKREIYLPMGLRSMSYKPYKYFDRNQIVPTEFDKYWREQMLCGDVHDPSAAMLGGISGNAGLFSNAYDLALLGQMWLNGGTYGGRRYLAQSTIELFTGPQEDSHRGLGFDKASKRGINAPEAPFQTYGHTGFTGTCIWVDPVNEIVFVFLSNRVHPKQKNWRINTYRIRQNIHSAIYRAMIRKGKEEKPSV